MTEQTEDPIDFRRYLAPVVRYRSLILVFCATSAVSSLLFTYVVSEKYLATTMVLYQPREATSFRPKTHDALGFPMPLVGLESIGNTLEAVLKSDELLEQVVRTLHLDRKEPQPAAGFWVGLYRDTKDRIKGWREDAMQLLKYGRLLSPDPVQQAMLTLRGNLGVKRANKTYTFELQAVDTNPARAAAVIDTVAQTLSGFLARKQIEVAKDSREKIEPRLKQSVAEIAAVRATVEEFKTKVGVSSLAEELSLKLKTVSGLQEELTSSRTELQSLENKRITLQQQLQTLEPSIAYSATTSDNPMVQQLRLDMARFSVDRSALLEKYTSSHPEVKAVDAQIAEVRLRLDRELEKKVSEESMRINDVYQKVLSDKLANDAELARLATNSDLLAASIERETAAAQRLMQNEPTLNELAHELKSAEENYQLLNETYSEARLTEAKTAAELVVLSHAMVPSAPARPIKILHVATSFVLSLVLAIGFCFFVDAFDSSVRTIAQAEEALGVPVFATIPLVPGGSNRPGGLLFRP